MPKWKVLAAPKFEKAFRRLAKKDRVTAKRIGAALQELAELEDPAVRLKPLQAELTGIWRLRVGNWRVIIDVQRDELVVLALDLGHRSTIYEKIITK